MSTQHEVFISYHGGGENPEKSSYPKAEELYKYLESNGISCFLCKKENSDDYCKAIDKAIKTCKHFILVACDRSKLSDWVYDEVNRFDAFHKNEHKQNCLLTAYIFGSITEAELYNFNSVFTTKDIVKGPNGFKRLLDILLSKRDYSAPVESLPVPDASANIQDNITARDISRSFLQRDLENFEEFTENDYETHCSILTERLKCMSTEIFSEECTNVVDELYNQILSSTQNQPAVSNVMRISGQPGTQKSYLIQMLYLWFSKNYGAHTLEPIYLCSQKIRQSILSAKRTVAEYLATLFDNLTISQGRRPIFFVDCVLNVVVDNLRLDYALRNAINQFNGAFVVVGINDVFTDNPTRRNPSPLVMTRYKNLINLTPVSMYDKKKCFRYIGTISKLCDNKPSNVYRILNDCGLLNIDHFIIDKIFEECDNTSPEIMDVFENDLLDALNGSQEDLARGAAFVFDYAYGSNAVDFRDPLHLKMIQLISYSSTIYMNCLLAIHFCNLLKKWSITQDYSFFNLILPKEITRFITQKINRQADLESIIIQLAEHYNELQPLGKSAISFYLGRLKTPNYCNKAVKLLHRYYKEAQNNIKQRVIDSQFNDAVYDRNDYKQDLFLLRGITVSLIYCDNRNSGRILLDYLHSLISNNLANSINRGFHLEYYGDKRYLPNQNMLDYEDKPTTGERTLRILCTSLFTHSAGTPNPSMLLELFTVASLLQVRIETDAQKVKFRISHYLKVCRELIERVLKKLNVRDEILLSYFQMVSEDFKNYIEKEKRIYSPEREICDAFLTVKDVKRTGWVMQNIDDPESIAEHMYSCWFIGLILLPDEHDANCYGYDKQKILNMLLIHDLAETKLSDIPKYEKKNYPNYDKMESDTMLRMLLKGTYSGISTMHPYAEAWLAWYEQKDENARIAKDIDTIQAIYQFLTYYQSFPECFSRERAINWLNEVYEVRTEIGQSILKRLVLDNERFIEIFEEFDGEY